MKLTEEQLATLVLAYHEGELTPEQQAQLDAYLVVNPDFQSELHDVIYLNPEQQNYSGPSLLKIEFEKITTYNSEEGHPYEKLAIGQVENLLTTAEEKIEASLQNDPRFGKIKHQIQQTILKPDLQITYPRTNQLLKEIPVRKLNYKMLYFAASSAAALILTFFIYNQQSAPYPTRMLAHKNNLKKSPNKKMDLERANRQDLFLVQQASAQTYNDDLQNLKQSDFVLTHIHEGPQALTTIENPYENTANIDFAIVDPIEYEITNPKNQNQIFPQPTQSQGLPASKAFTKEPVTVKTFLLQKTNERIFGTATPSTDLRYETMARYASETIGLPVKYAVEEGNQHDKIVFQLGPISIERTRNKK